MTLFRMSGVRAAAPTWLLERYYRRQLATIQRNYAVIIEASKQMFRPFTSTTTRPPKLSALLLGKESHSIVPIPHSNLQPSHH